MKRIFVMLLLFSMLFMSSCIRLPTDAETETTTPEEITTPDPWSSVAPNLRDPLERPQDAYDFRSLTEFQDVIFNPTMHQDHVLYLERMRHNQLHSEMLDFVYTQQKLHVPAIDDVPLITSSDSAAWISIYGEHDALPEISYYDVDTGISLSMIYMDAFTEPDLSPYEDIADMWPVLHRDMTKQWSAYWMETVDLPLPDGEVMAFRNYNENPAPYENGDNYVFVYNRMVIGISFDEMIDYEEFFASFSMQEVTPE